MKDEDIKAIKMLEFIVNHNSLLGYKPENRQALAEYILNLIEKMKEIIESKNRTIESLSLESDKWFVSSVNKQKAYVELERKTDEIIDELITALAEERGIDEDEIREDFLNDR